MIQCYQNSFLKAVVFWLHVTFKVFLHKAHIPCFLDMKVKDLISFFVLYDLKDIQTIMYYSDFKLL